ncbi:MAG: hypothetical protein M1831_007101 [Alyxoria varia]|nr:MAG: hypothetical protein M1831_007101 [Alyxoria varia]
MAIPHTYRGKAPVIMGINAVECSIATILIALRLWYRRKTPYNAKWALVWVVIAWVLGIFHFTFLTLSVSYGIGQHTWELSRDQADLALQWNWVMQAFQIFNYAFGKASVVAFLLELQGPTHPKKAWALKAVAVINFIVGCITPCMALLQCSPPQKLWKPYLEGTCKPGPNLIQSYVQSAINAATDFGLAFYPSLIIWDLHMSRPLKLAISAILGLGAFMGVCAIMKALQLNALANSADSTYDYYGLICWSNTEMWVTIIIPSIPPLWPLFRKTWQGLLVKMGVRGIPSHGPYKESHELRHHADSRSDRQNGKAFAPLTIDTNYSHFHHLGSRSRSEDAIMPYDGVLIKKDVTVKPDHDEDSTDDVTKA